MAPKRQKPGHTFSPAQAFLETVAGHQQLFVAAWARGFDRLLLCGGEWSVQGDRFPHSSHKINVFLQNMGNMCAAMANLLNVEKLELDSGSAGALNTWSVSPPVLTGRPTMT